MACRLGPATTAESDDNIRRDEPAKDRYLGGEKPPRAGLGRRNGGLRCGCYVSRQTIPPIDLPPLRLRAAGFAAASRRRLPVNCSRTDPGKPPESSRNCHAAGATPRSTPAYLPA